MQFKEILQMVDDIFNILKVVFPYVNENCHWMKYTNDKKIPFSLLSNTDDIERGNSQAGHILTKSPRISDDTLENIIISKSNNSLCWIQMLEQQFPNIYQFVENHVFHQSLLPMPQN